MCILRVRLCVFLLILALLLHATTGEATTVAELTFTALVKQADVITVGTVSDIREQWDVAQNVPLTLVTFANLTVLKGNPGGTLTLEFLGGTMPSGLVMMIPGVPRFRLGEKTVVFQSGNLREFCPIVGIWQGLLRVVQDPQRGVDTVSDNFWHPIVAIQNGAFVKRTSLAVRQEPLSLPVLLLSIQQLLQQSTNRP